MGKVKSESLLKVIVQLKNPSRKGRRSSKSGSFTIESQLKKRPPLPWTLDTRARVFLLSLKNFTRAYLKHQIALEITQLLIQILVCHKPEEEANLVKELHEYTHFCLCVCFFFLSFYFPYRPFYLAAQPSLLSSRKQKRLRYNVAKGI